MITTNFSPPAPPAIHAQSDLRISRSHPAPRNRDPRAVGSASQWQISRIMRVTAIAVWRSAGCALKLRQPRRGIDQPRELLEGKSQAKKRSRRRSSLVYFMCRLLVLLIGRRFCCVLSIFVLQSDARRTFHVGPAILGAHAHRITFALPPGSLTFRSHDG